MYIRTNRQHATPCVDQSTALQTAAVSSFKGLMLVPKPSNFEDMPFQLNTSGSSL
jgi:hypothetical protein